MKEVIEKLDAIEASQSEKVAAVEAKAAEIVETAKAEIGEKIAALEAKIATVSAPAIIKVEKTVRGDVNKMVREQLRDFTKQERRMEKEIKLFESADQYDAFLKEASALTGSGAGVGGRTAYDPVFHALRLANPMRGLSRSVSTDGSTYQYRVKSGDAGASWGYAIQNNGTATSEATNIWQQNMSDLNVQFPIRTADRKSTRLNSSH